MAHPTWTLRDRLALSLLCSVQFMLILDLSIVNVALPSIQRDLGASRELLQWVISGYALSFGGFLMLAGGAADLYGRRRFFMLGLGLFALASLGGGLSQSAAVLIGARVMQGLGAAVVSPASLSLLTTTFAEGPRRNRALAVWGAVAAGGGAAGSLLGGVVTGTLGWAWVFFLNVPIGLIAIAVSPAVLPDSRDDSRPPRLDVAGAVLVTLGALLLVFGLSQAETGGLSSPLTFGPVVGALAAFAGFAVVERRSAAPLVPLGLLRQPALSGANVVVLLLLAVITGQGFFATFYLQQLLHYSPLATGLAFLPIAALIMLMSTLSPRLAHHFGTRRMLIVGMALIAAAMLYFARIPALGAYAWDLLPGFIALAIGMGLSFFSATVAATNGVANHQQGIASGLLNTSGQVGAALGLAVLISVGAAASSVFSNSAAGADADAAFLVAFRAANACGAVLAVIGSLVAAFVIRPYAPSSD